MEKIMLLCIANKVSKRLTYMIAEEITNSYKDDDHSSFVEDYAFVENYLRIKLGKPQASSPSSIPTGLGASRYISEN